jgi:hypothetical protein
MRWSRATAVIAIFLLCEGGSPQTAKTLAEIARERVLSVPDQDIKDVERLLAGLCDDQLGLFGFDSQGEAQNATLIEPAAIFDLSVQDVLMLGQMPLWRPPDLGPEKVLYLVAVSTNIRAYVVLENIASSWRIAEYGDRAHARRLASALNRVDGAERFLIESRDLHVQLAAVQTASTIRLASVALHGGLDLDLTPLPLSSLTPRITKWMQDTLFPP